MEDSPNFPPKKLYIIAGEASGDLHGSNVMKFLFQHQPEIDIRFWGGDKMMAQGGTLAKHIKELAFMGFVEVLLNIRTILRNMKFCKQDITDFKPDALLLIDYPGFNLRIAEWAKKNDIKVYYYISPTVWAWKESRVEKIRRDVHRLFVILPFEAPFYAKHNLEVEYVGHPLLDEIENYNALPAQPLLDQTTDKRPIIALLPGSRVQELKKKLPIMLALPERFPNHRFVIAGAPNMPLELYESFMNQNRVEVVFGQTYSLLQQSETAVVTSGTATLETALFEIPQVVCYVGNSISYTIAKRLVNIKYISLPNLILDRDVVMEFIQNECTTDNLENELNRIVVGGDKRQKMLSDYSEIKQLLGKGGASEKVALGVLKTMNLSFEI